MKKVVFASSAVLLLSLISQMQVLAPTEANPVPFKGAGFVLPTTIENPSNGSTQSPSFLAKFHANGKGVFSLPNNNTPTYRGPYQGDFFYVLDGQDTRNSGIKIEEVSQNNFLITGQVYLSNLDQGNHNLTIYWGVRLESGTIMTDTLWGETSQFSVDSRLTPQPTPSIDPTSTVPEFSLWTLPLLLSIIAATAGLLIYRKKRKR